MKTSFELGNHMAIKTKLMEMLGIKVPIISALMGPFYTTKLTIAVSAAGA